jgi:hypothetical protein
MSTIPEVGGKQVAPLSRLKTTGVGVVLAIALVAFAALSFYKASLNSVWYGGAAGSLVAGAIAGAIVYKSSQNPLKDRPSALAAPAEVPVALPEAPGDGLGVPADSSAAPVASPEVPVALPEAPADGPGVSTDSPEGTVGDGTITRAGPPKYLNLIRDPTFYAALSAVGAIFSDSPRSREIADCIRAMNEQLPLLPQTFEEKDLDRAISTRISYTMIEVAQILDRGYSRRIQRILSQSEQAAFIEKRDRFMNALKTIDELMSTAKWADVAAEDRDSAEEYKGAWRRLREEVRNNMVTWTEGVTSYFMLDERSALTVQALGLNPPDYDSFRVR